MAQNDKQRIREEFREKFMFADGMVECDAEDLENFWLSILDKEIEKAEARGRQQNRDAFTDRWVEDSRKEEREGFIEILDEAILDSQGPYRKFPVKDLIQIIKNRLSQKDI